MLNDHARADAQPRPTSRRCSPRRRRPKLDPPRHRRRRAAHRDRRRGCTADRSAAATSRRASSPTSSWTTIGHGARSTATPPRPDAAPEPRRVGPALAARLPGGRDASSGPASGSPSRASPGSASWRCCAPCSCAASRWAGSRCSRRADAADRPRLAATSVRTLLGERRQRGDPARRRPRRPDAARASPRRSRTPGPRGRRPLWVAVTLRHGHQARQGPAAAAAAVPEHASRCRRCGCTSRTCRCSSRSSCRGSARADTWPAHRRRCGC